MNLFTRGIFALTVSFACSSAFAQQPKKPAFNEAAPRVEVSKTELQQTFALVKGDAGYFSRGQSAINIEGEVIQTLTPSARMQTVIIRSQDQSLIQLNRISEPGREVFYTGRISNINGEYGYVLKRTGDEYHFEKYKTADILQLCSR